jgi:hypothetical protein
LVTLKGTASNRADIIELLNNVQATLNNSMHMMQKRLISIYDRRIFRQNCQELDELKRHINNIPRQTDDEQKDDATMLDPSLIQPIG